MIVRLNRILLTACACLLCASVSAQYLATYDATLQFENYEYRSGTYHLAIDRDSAALWSPSYSSESKYEVVGRNVDVTTGDPDARLMRIDLNEGTVRFKTSYGGSGRDGEWTILTDNIPVLDWEISQQTKVCAQGYACQRASASFGGRHYVAWFIPSLPTSIGIYKLHGLPGLTAELRSSDQKVGFVLESVEPLKNHPLPSFTVGTPRSYVELQQQVITLLLRVEAMSTPGSSMTSKDPPRDANFEVDKWHYIRDYKLAEVKAKRRKLTVADRIER